jgi:hypothetical protein
VHTKWGSEYLYFAAEGAAWAVPLAVFFAAGAVMSESGSAGRAFLLGGI